MEHDIKINLTKSHTSFHFSYFDQIKNRLAVSDVSLMPLEHFINEVPFFFEDEKKQKEFIKIAEDNATYGFYSRLNVPNIMRGKGIATKLLNETLNYCNENKILLINQVNAYGDMSEKDLLMFYEKNGMVLIKDNLMIYAHNYNSHKNTNSLIKKLKI